MKAIRTILACIRRADEKYNLINQGDKIVVGLSGGKDSLALCYALTLYQKFSHTDFQIQPVTLDLGFDGFNPEPLKEFCQKIGLSLIVSDSRDVYPILKANQKNHNHLPCSICSRMKKAAINKVANEIGYNKVAFAHHADDAIETLFMNEFYGGRVATFAPKMHLEKADITFIRPLILCREKDIITLIKEQEFPVLSSHCPADKETTREEIKVMLNEIYKKYPTAKENLLSMLDHYEKEDLWGKELYYQIDNCGLTLKPVIHAVDANIMNKIRCKVFVNEKCVSLDDELDLDPRDSDHAYLIYLKDKAIGTIRYRFIEEKMIKIERFAILKEYRKQGYGVKALNFLIDMLWKEYNPVTFIVHAMLESKNIYQKVGFIPEGETYLEANIEHITMKKS